MKYIVAIILALCSISSRAGDFTVMGGMSHFTAPDSGTYWNNNQPYDNFMNPAAFGLRYDTDTKDSWSFGIQYTHFGEVKMDALAVLTDAPYPGGYDPATGGCTGGECKPLRRWRMRSDAQSLAFIGAKHFTRWSLEGGLNIYEVKTAGNVLDTDGSSFYKYKEARYLDVLPMFGVGYMNAPWSFRLQQWFMYAPGETPEAFNQKGTTTVLVGYSF